MDDSPYADAMHSSTSADSFIQISSRIHTLFALVSALSLFAFSSVSSLSLSRPFFVVFIECVYFTEKGKAKKERTSFLVPLYSRRQHISRISRTATIRSRARYISMSDSVSPRGHFTFYFLCFVLNICYVKRRLYQPILVDILNTGSRAD